MSVISLEQAVKNGIEVERAAERFYRLLADSTDDEEARTFLRELADQEVQHASRIEKLGESLGAGELPKGADDNVELLETAPSWAFVDGIDYRQALVVALENEEHAALYYCALADAFEGVVADFFQKLYQDEELHSKMLREKVRR